VADITRLFRETVGAGYYRAHPTESMRYVWSKVQFAQRSTSPDAMLSGLGFDVLSARAGLSKWAPDLNKMMDAVTASGAADGQDPGNVSFDGALFLYGVIRSLRPQVVVETGVAAGVSTSFIGAALIENGHGRLISIDLPPAPVKLVDGASYDWSKRGVGWAIPDRLREALGDRHTLIREDVRTSLPRLLDDVSDIDCFIHDDLHSPDHMRWEFDLVWPCLRPGGVIVADDINHAWTAFASDVGLRDQALTNTRRLSCIRKPLS
jgi:predicted O-methyltransferase YrrM